MKRKRISPFAIIGVLLVLVIVICLEGGFREKQQTEAPYKVCMITDAGDITDQSFNQLTYEACKEYCETNQIPFTYKKPEGNTDASRTTMVDVAVAEGYNIIVMPGAVFAKTLLTTTGKYPDVKFISLDMSESDLLNSAVGSDYSAHPEAYDVKDYYYTDNLYGCSYKEEISGYLAGYTSVRLGYRNLGFLGGQAVPGVIRYGYGFILGVNDAAEDLGISDQVSLEYAYGGQFYGSPEITAVMDTWYGADTEVVFCCGGSIYTSAAEAAQNTGGYLIGVDQDQSEAIDAYREGMTVTSALKRLDATVNYALDAITKLNTWDQLKGEIECRGLLSDQDMSKNFVGISEKTTQWNEDFRYEDYKKLVGEIFNGEKIVEVDTNQVPQVSCKLHMRDGSIR